jgi:hypothetical protein
VTKTGTKAISTTVCSKMLLCAFSHRENCLDLLVIAAQLFEFLGGSYDPVCVSLLCVSVYLSVSLLFCLFVTLSLYLSVSPSFCACFSFYQAVCLLSFCVKTAGSVSNLFLPSVMILAKECLCSSKVERERERESKTER